MLNQLLDKHGNPVSKLMIGSASDHLKGMSMTYSTPKLKPGYYNRHGGKIMDEANAKGNALDTLNGVNSVRPLQRVSTQMQPNSRCLNRAHVDVFGRNHSVRDLHLKNGVRLLSTLPTTSLQAMRDAVESKQKELAELARLKGIYDPTVLRMQLELSRSKLFREYAVKLISVKPGSQTSGVYREIYDREDDLSFSKLTEYLRQEIYHPNKYRASAVKRV